MQLLLFERSVLAECKLICNDSPKRAFYRLMIVFDSGRYWIEKESGCGGKVLDVRRWPMVDEKAANRYYKNKIRQKLKPGRHRVYREAS